MSILDPNAYREAENRFREALNTLSSQLSSSALGNIQHYLINTELELAYESLLLSIREENVAVPEHCKKVLYPMGVLLNLNKEGVLIGHSWPSLSQLIAP